MRILFISNYYPPVELGGMEQLTQDIALQLKDNGHDIHILSSNFRAEQIRTFEPDVERVLHLESHDHVHYHPHYTITRHWSENQNKRHLERAVDKFAPDVIFIWGMWNLPVSLALHAEQLLPGRVIYYIASYWPAEPDAHSAFWSDGSNQGGLSSKKKWLGKLAQPLILGSPLRNQPAFEHVLCVSQYVKNFLVEQAAIPETNVRVVNNGIDIDQFVVRQAGNLEQEISLLYAGRLVPEKGVGTVIEGVGYFRKAHPNFPIRLSIIGSGAADFEAHLHKMAKEFNVFDITEFRSQVQREAMPSILAEHDVLIFPSIWPEPLARMTQEGMACGLVVIGTETGGTPELLQDGVNGLTYQAGDGHMLAEKLALLADNPGLVKTLGQAARQTIEDHFTFERMYTEIERYLTSVKNNKEEIVE